MPISLSLSFLTDATPQLDSLEFVDSEGCRVRCSRGSFNTVASGGHLRTFSWTRAVRALSILALRTYLARHDSSIAPLISGVRGSLAASLDYSLSKEPQWLLDMFGVDSTGRARARKFIRRENPERKRPGPVTISFCAGLRQDACFSFYLDNCRLSPAEARVLLLNLEQQEPASTNLLESAVRAKTNTARFQVPLATPQTNKGGVVSMSITDLIFDVIEDEGSLTIEQLHMKLRDYCRPMLPTAHIDHAIYSLLRRNLCLLEEGRLKQSLSSAGKLGEFFCSLRDMGTNAGYELVGTSSRSCRFEFSSLAEMDAFLAPLYDVCVAHISTADTTWWHLNHSTWPLMRPQVECRRADTYPVFADTKYLCRGSSPIDSWVKQFYSRMGLTGHLGSRSPFLSDFWIIGDLFVEHLIPDKLQKGIDGFIDSFSSVDVFDNVEFERSFFKTREKCSVEIHLAPGLTENTRACLADLGNFQPRE